MVEVSYCRAQILKWSNSLYLLFYLVSFYLLGLIIWNMFCHKTVVAVVFIIVSRSLTVSSPLLPHSTTCSRLFLSVQNEAVSMVGLFYHNADLNTYLKEFSILSFIQVCAFLTSNNHSVETFHIYCVRILVIRSQNLNFWIHIIMNYFCIKCFVQ